LIPTQELPDAAGEAAAEAVLALKQDRQEVRRTARKEDAQAVAARSEF